MAQAYLIDMRRDFPAFNAACAAAKLQPPHPRYTPLPSLHPLTRYAAAFGALRVPPTRTTVEVAQLPPGGRIAVELKVVAHCPL